MSASNHIREPLLQELTIANIMTFSAQQLTPVNEKQKAEIELLLTSDDALISLAGLISKFLMLKNNYEALSGLTNSEVTKLNALINNRRQFLQDRKNKPFDTHAYAAFIANEKDIVPLTKTLDYWNANITSLRKLELWEDINTLTIKEAEKNGESTELINERLHRLNDIKNEWTTHQVFSGFTSENLLTFYRDIISVLENCVIDYLNANHQTPEIVKKYIEHSLYEIHELKKQAIHSMLCRLSASQYFDDMTCDDILFFTTDRIDKQCNINTQGIGKKPDFRRSLTLTLQDQFRKDIEDYARENPSEKSILYDLHEMKKNRLKQKSFVANDVVFKTDDDAQRQINALLEDIFADNDFDAKNMQNFFHIRNEALFCNTDILVRIEKMIYANRATINYNELCAIANLLQYLASDEVKISLLNAYREKVNDNPYWMALVNHLGEKNTLASIEYAINMDSSIPHQAAFFTLLEYAKHLGKLNHQIHDMMKLSILNEAGILPAENDKLKLQTMLHTPLISDAQLLRLWSACANKLMMGQLQTGMRLAYVSFIIKMLTITAEAIFARNSEKPALLSKFLEKIDLIPDIVGTIQTIFNDADNQNSLWGNKPTHEQLTESLHGLVRKAFVLQLTQYTMQFAQDNLPKDQFAEFKLAINDAAFINHDNLSPYSMIISILNFVRDIGLSKNNFSALRNHTEILLEKVTIDNQLSLTDNLSIFLRDLIGIAVRANAILNGPSSGTQKDFPNADKSMYLTAK